MFLPLQLGGGVNDLGTTLIKSEWSVAKGKPECCYQKKDECWQTSLWVSWQVIKQSRSLQELLISQSGFLQTQSWIIEQWTVVLLSKNVFGGWNHNLDNPESTKIIVHRCLFSTFCVWPLRYLEWVLHKDKEKEDIVELMNLHSSERNCALSYSKVA